MSEYKIPEEYYFRIHHVRPRFKGDIENVLIYVANEIARIGEQPTDAFVSALDNALFSYPGNINKTKKTIDNWRTEISALFGFIEHMNGKDKPGRRALELARDEDLVRCFKIFLYNFQYPGAHIKPKNALEQIETGVHFKPAQYILKVLRYANRRGGNAAGITKFEACNCIFNDLRVTRDNEGPKATWNRILKNRRDKMDYDQTGDVIRYAGDIIDYMEIANLLKTYDSRMYYLNTLEEETIIKFCESNEWFAEYDNMIRRRSGTLAAVTECANGWFRYVNRDINNTDFATDILSYIANDENDLAQLRKMAAEEQNQTGYADFIGQEKSFEHRVATYFDGFTTKDIGDIGEGLVYGHECMRVKTGGREDLIHLIKRIPTQFAVGYDISSVELDERKRYIEVKTTVSSKPLHFNKVHMTKNEWNTANSTKDRYYIYRLMLSKTERKLFLIQDPVGKYKNDIIEMVQSGDGADITFDLERSGQFEELLTWKK